MDIKEQLLKSFTEELDNEDDYLEFEVISEGAWEQDHKYQFCNTIIYYNNQYYVISQSRSGSYHTRWYYNEPSIREVKKVEKIVTQISYE